jgi:hypothetical protein
MKTDLYKNLILTVIAATLIWLAIEREIHPPAALAQDRAVKVVIVGVDEAAEAGIPVSLMGGSKYEHLKVATDNPLAVSIVGR